MRKILALIILSVTILTGCSKEPDINPITTAYTDNGKGTYYVGEWISPEGVHYYIFECSYRCGSAPMYDNDGNLVIDRKE